MQRTIINLGLVLIAASVVLYGCGGADLLDEVNDRYQVSIELTGGDGDAPNDLECRAIADCDGDGNPDDGEPGLAGIIGTLTITSSAAAHYLQIDSYSVEYRRQQSPLVGGGTGLPPVLDAPETLEITFNVNPGTTSSYVLPNILDIDNKLDYDFQGGLATFAQGIYVIRVRLYGSENEEDITFTVDTVVRLMDIDNCTD